jgi:uncharacterized protein involved in exopolysaccharide biosynthesis
MDYVIENNTDQPEEQKGYPGPSGSRRKTSMRDFLGVIFRRKGIIIVVFLLAVVAVLVLNASTPTSYISDTRYQILSWEEELNSELEVIRSQQIHQMATRDLEERNIRDSNGNALRINPTKISASTSGKSTVINISYKSLDPDAARHVTQALTTSYIDFRHETRRGPEVEANLREQIDQYEERLVEWEQRKADYMTEESVASPSEERFFLLQERKGAQSQLTDVQSRIASRQAQVEILRGLKKERELSPDLSIYPFSEARTREDANLDILSRELMLTRSQYYDVLSKYTESHPEVQSKRRQVLSLEKAFDKELESYERHIEARLEVLLAQEASLNQLLDALSAELAELPAKEMKLNQIDRVINALRFQYDALVRSSIDARIKRSGLADWNVILLSPASEVQAIRVHDYVRLATLPIFSLLLGIGMAFLADGLDHSIKDASDAEAYLGLPVLTSVSPFGGK